VFGLRLRSGVKPAPCLTLGLKFRSDKNISKWRPEARLLLPILVGKCPAGGKDVFVHPGSVRWQLVHRSPGTR
jgi:hypothetical protein